MDFISAAMILRSKDIIGICRDFVEQDDTPMLIDSFIQSIRSNTFSCHTFVKELNITSFVENPNNVPCACSSFDPKYID